MVRNPLSVEVVDSRQPIDRFLGMLGTCAVPRSAATAGNCCIAKDGRRSFELSCRYEWKWGTLLTK